MILLPLFSFTPTSAHELWIEPIRFETQVSDELSATLKNGQNFAGIDLAWFDSRQERFDWSMGAVTTAFEGRAGDVPTVTMAPETDGLLTLVFQSTPSTITYRDWDSFARFVEHKDLYRGAELHAERGLPESGFTEAYIRFSKSVISVGSGQGEDQRFGLEHEMVLLTNPYSATTDTVMVQLFYEGYPNMDAQIEIFDRATDGEITILTTRTDSNGIAEIPVKAGHDYMLDSVMLREPSPELAAETGAVWETLWANITFAVPE